MQILDISKLDFRTKLFIFLIALPATSFFIDRKYLLILIILTSLILLFGNLNLGKLWKNLRVYLIILAIFFLILIPFISHGDLMNILLYSSAVFVRLILFLVSGLIYALSTSPNEIPTALISMRIPHRYGILFMVGMKLYPLILREVDTIRDSLRARGFEARFSILRPKESLKYLSYLMQPVLLTTLEVGMKMGETLALRGYNPYGKITVPPDQKLKLPDYVALFFALCLLLLAIFVI